MDRKNNLVIRLCGYQLMKGSANYEGTHVPDITTLSNTELFDNLLDLMPYGVFWKDEERRFVGANQFFLDYYGFDSLDDILGKTDEEMGWHVDPDPYRNDEWRVIHNGETVEGAPGQCIAKGRSRNIICYKKPVYKNDKIVGLIGFFVDIDTHNPKAMEETDDLTHLMNANGAVKSFASFKKSYRFYGVDFMITSINVISFKQFNAQYGRELGDKMLKAIGEAIVEAVGANSVIARIAGDEFVVLNQISTPASAKEINLKIRQAIRDIKQVDNVACTANASIETSCYSELSEGSKKSLITELAGQHHTI